jgi:Do/DeqQ family serine protease
MQKTPTLLVLAAAAAFGGFAATAIRVGVEQPAHAETAPAATATALPAVVNGQPLPSLAPMLQKVLPSVVSVHTKQRVNVSPFGNDPMLRRMFPELSQERINESLGSGVIIDAEKGYILTNHHVIENADDVSVTLSDGRTLKALPVGSDPDTDVAVMRIPAEKLTALPMADSSQLRVGDCVVAVGNPFGVGQTVTSGIVSAVGRSNIPGMGYQNFIQTDASINPGNSGGALVNLQGQLVGINTASFNPRGSMAGNIGLGFAIPTSLARNVMEQLITNKGVVKRGTLGIDTADLSDADVRRLGLKSNNGARVTRVYAGSSAEASGLRVGDIVTAANGQTISNSDDLRNIQGLQMANATLSLDVLRNGTLLKLNAGLKEQPRDGASLDDRLAGVTFGELPESLRREGASGIIVTAVSPRSRAAQAGLRAGDVLLAGSNGNFNDLASFRASFSTTPTNLVFRVWRNGTQGQLLIR